MIEEEKAIKWECVGDIISTKKNGFLCPTQALLARWLREKYEIPWPSCCPRTTLNL